jgi:cell division protein FtsL
MARSSAATVARPPAKRRKPAQAGTKHASSQTHRRSTRRSSGQASGSAHARKRPVAAAEVRAASVAAPSYRGARRPRPAAPRRRANAAPLVRRLIHGRTGAFLDGVLRGRACVGIVFVLLAGVVFANVSLLEMNKGIAATNAEATGIEQENAKLRRQIAPLASSERIQTEAVKHGYSLPAAGDVRYITGDVDKNARRAAQRMTAPGMGDGTASRPAAQVQQELQAQMQARNPQAPAPVAPAPEPTAPVAQTTATSPPAASCQDPASCEPPAASPTAPSPGTAP